METIQRATTSRIETRSIRDANATPRAMTSVTSGRGQRVAIVASASEVNAAVASRPQATRTSPGGEKQHKSEAGRTSGHAASESTQGSSRGNENAGHPQQTMQTREASPAQHGQSHSASSHAQNAHKAPAQVEAPPPSSGQQHHEAAPAQGHSESMTQPAHQQASAHAHQPPPPNQAKNPAGKDKKAEKGKKDEKGEGPSSPKDPIRP
jgi:hypothetical protein